MSEVYTDFFLVKSGVNQIRVIVHKALYRSLNVDKQINKKKNKDYNNLKKNTNKNEKNTNIKFWYAIYWYIRSS